MINYFVHLVPTFYRSGRLSASWAGSSTKNTVKQSPFPNDWSHWRVCRVYNIGRVYNIQLSSRMCTIADKKLIVKQTQAWWLYRIHSCIELNKPRISTLFGTRNRLDWVSGGNYETPCMIRQHLPDLSWIHSVSGSQHLGSDVSFHQNSSLELKK